MAVSNNIFDKKDEFGYPSQFVPKAEKLTRDYNLRMMKAIYSDWDRGGLRMNKARLERIKRNRLYADGLQDNDIYKNLMNIKKQASFVNLSWEIVGIIPKYVKLMMGYFMGLGENITATAIDPVATERYHDDKAMMQAEIALHEDLAWIDKMLGNSQDPEKFKPRNNEELDIFMEMNYKQQWEVVMEEMLNMIAWLNKLDGTVKYDVIRSFVVDGAGGIRRYKDKNGKFKLRAVDMLESLLGFSKKRDYSDCEKFGEFLPLTISDLREMAGDQFTEDEYKQMAEMNCGLYGNPSKDWFYDSSRYSDFPSYESFRILVLDCVYLTTNRHVFKKSYTGVGDQYNFNETDFNYQAPKNSKGKVEVIKRNVKVWMEAKWVVGTDFIYDYGAVQDQQRNPECLAEPMPPFHIFKPEQKSIVEHLIPFADGIQLAMLKFQHGLAKAKPPGLSIEVGGLEEVPDGRGGTYTPIDLIAIYEQTGNYIWRRKDVDDPDAAGNIDPIRELVGGLGTLINDTNAAIGMYVSMIQQVSGISEGLDGQLPTNDRTSATAMRIASTQTSNTLRSTYDAWVDVKQSTMTCVGLAVQDAIKKGEVISGYVQGVGQKLKWVQSTAEVALHDFGIKIEARPTEQEMAILDIQVQEALKVRSETGLGGIEPEDAFLVRQLMQTSVKYAAQLLAVRKRRRAKEDEEKQMRLAEHKGQVDQQSAAAASEARQQEIMAQAQGQIAVNDKLAQNKLTELEKQHQYKMEQIREQGIQKNAQINTKLASDIDSILSPTAKS